MTVATTDQNKGGPTTVKTSLHSSQTVLLSFTKIENIDSHFMRAFSDADITLGTAQTDDEGSQCSEDLKSINRERLSDMQSESEGSLDVFHEGSIEVKERNDDCLVNQTLVKSTASLSLSANQRRPSIKEYDFSSIPIKDKLNAWKQLPKPDLNAIHPIVRRPSRDSITVPRKVRFHEIQFREYDQTIGDNPCVSYGPPISLDWNYEESGCIDVEEYEANRGRRRGMREMIMNYYVRTNLLTFKYGATEAELQAATKSANREKRSRALTKAFLPCQALEDFAQSAVRKTKRLAAGNRRVSLKK